MPITDKRAAMDAAFDHCLNALQRGGVPEHPADRMLLIDSAVREGSAEAQRMSGFPFQPVAQALTVAERVLAHATSPAFKVPTHPADVRVLRAACLAGL